MSERPDLRKGWCPGALRPMAARDGMLVRLKITSGIVPSELALAVAGLAERHGNGLLDLSARANLQLRGVRSDALPALLDDLGALGLLDETATGEAVRNVLGSPMAGVGQRRPGGAHPDTRPLVAALERALVNDPALHALPAKFGFLVDDGGAPSLAGLAADIRFDWVAAEGAFAVGLGGTAAVALRCGLVAPDTLVVRALTMAYQLLARPGEPRRIGAMVREIGREATATWFGASMATAASSYADPQVVGLHTFDDVPTFGLAAPFGRLDAAMLRAAARAGKGELRLTPWRTILLPGVVAAEVPGFIVDPADPRLRVAACTGRLGCERGTTDTHADAAALARVTAALPGRGVALHVSGCAKGCARPQRTTVALVGRSGRYDLVRDGRAGDAPTMTNLDSAAVGAVLGGVTDGADVRGET